MMFKKLTVFLACMALVFTSCNMISEDTSDSVTENIMSSANAVLKAIPENEVELPLSLQEQDASRSRAINDIDTFSDFSAEAGVKANGWYEINDRLSGSNMGLMFIRYIKAVADQADLDFGNDIVLGELDPPAGETGPDGTSDAFDMGVIRLDKLSDTQVEVFWNVPFNMPDDSGNVVSMSYLINILLTVNSDDSFSSEIFMLMKSDGQDMVFNSYSTYDGVTGSSLEYSMYDNEPWYQILNKTDNVISYGQYGEWDGNAHYSIAWASDAYGGVARKGTYNGNANAGIEIYDSNGYLVQESWGEDNLDNQTDWLDQNDSDNAAYTYNLATDGGLTEAPDSIEVKYTWNGTSNDITCKVDGITTTLTGMTDSKWRMVFNPVAGWTSGDSEYWQTDWSNGDGYWTSTFTKGYVVPDASTFLGDDFYMSHNFPLRYLELDKDGYTLKRKQMDDGQEYSWEWEDENGDTQTETYTWIWYDWWLENGSDSEGDDTIDEADVRINNVQERDYYIWNSDYGQSVKQKMFTVYTSKDVPDNFRLTTDAQNTVDTVKANINTVAEDMKDKLDQISYPADRLPILADFPEID